MFYNLDMDLRNIIEQAVQESTKDISFFKRLFAWENQKELIATRISSNEMLINLLSKDEEETDKSSIDKLNELIEQANAKANIKTEELLKAESRIKEAERKYDELISKLSITNEEIADKTKALWNVFAKSSGGAGAVGELRLKSELIKYFGEEDKGLWIENLAVGSDNVEFAFKSSRDSKWIPVDSKLLQPETDSEGKFIIDSKYLTRIGTEVTKFKKYLSKKETENFGVLVLPSIEVMEKAYSIDPSKFSSWMNEGVVVASPLTFIQFAEIIALQADALNKRKQMKEIIKPLELVIRHSNIFYNNVEKSVELINRSFETNLKDMKNNLDLVKKQFEE